MSREILTVVGFLLLALGVLALVLSLVGIQLTFLAWIDAFGGLAGFLIRIAMVVAGIILMYMARIADEPGE